MSYHFPNERRRVERRVVPAVPYAGQERRHAERRDAQARPVRKAEPMNRGVLWTAVLMVLVVADSACLDGAYRHMLIDWGTGMVATVRDWSAHVWDWRA